MTAQLRLITLVLVLALTVGLAPASVLAARAEANRAHAESRSHRHGSIGHADPPVTRGAQVIRYAKRLLGVPYRYGGSSPGTGFDCSGFVRFVYQRFGVTLPHSSYADFALGRSVPRGALQPGDLVFFHGLGHVGLYVGGGRFIHAPHTGTRVQLESMSGAYSARFDGARRVLAPVARRVRRPPSLAPLARWLVARARPK